MYDPVELLEAMRGVCLRGLEAAFEDLRKKKQRFFVEPAMQRNDALAREGPLSLPFRCDALVVSRDGKSVTPQFFRIEKRWNFSPVEFDHGGLLVALSSCHWENLRISISGNPEAVAASVKAWFEPAFMAAEERAESEIQNVVHDLSDFVAEGQITTFKLDCGTMPAAQMFAMFDRLREAGATRVELAMP
jgi:hypothetical protein